MKVLTILLILLSVNTFAGELGQDASKDCNKGNLGGRSEKQLSRSSASTEVPATPAKAVKK